MVRRDPMAMLPFIGYDAGDYLGALVEHGRADGSRALPKMFYVNWFRRDTDGGFLWPGFGENSRVLKWIVERLDGTADAESTAMGNVPTAGGLDVDGLDVSPAQLTAALAVSRDEWAAELPLIREWFTFLGESVPAELRAESADLESRLAAESR